MAAYDFSGWATKNDIKCADGRTIRKDAFIGNNHKKVPLIWNHDHDNPESVLGHAFLENRPEGVYAYCSLNNTEKAKTVRELIDHCDLDAFSIYANKLKHGKDREVLHGDIKELSLVLAGANPGALIEYPLLAHGDNYEYADDEAYIYPDVKDFSFEHGDLDWADDEDETEEPEAEETIEHSDKNDKEDKEVANAPENNGGDKTIGEIFETLTDEQKTAVYAIIGQALEDAKSGNNNEEDDNVKHSAFDNEYHEDEYLTKEEIAEVFADAKRMGSLREAVLAHSIDTTGMDVAVGEQTYGFNDADMLFPEYKSLNTPPEWIKRNTDWVNEVVGGATKTPFTRIKSLFADITEDEARARGYMKGNEKKEEVFTTLKRTTDPQTIYKKQKLDRDDILDITDFNIVPWIRAEMEVMLDEELGRAMLIGDGRLSDAEDKIQESHIRPIAKDVPLFNIQVQVDVAEDATGAEKADAIIEGILRGRKDYKGSGNPTFFTTEDWVTEMLLLKDGIGHRLYKTVPELATALRVSKITTVEVMEGQKINDRDLVGIIVNMKDYRLGNDKGGEKTLFDDFDIDYNQYKYLIETRRSGALVRPKSAMTVTIATASEEVNEG